MGEVETMKTETYWAQIYVGLKNLATGIEADISAIETECQIICNRVGLCVTVTPTKYIYTGGCENGAIVGLINYPIFPGSA